VRTRSNYSSSGRFKIRSFTYAKPSQALDLYGITNGTSSEQSVAPEQNGNYLIFLMAHRRYRT
jgi:hypothetical protein